VTRLAGRHVVLGVSGGIASYKSCILARRLVEAGAIVDVVMTRAATEFVGPVTFEALTGRPVVTSLWTRGRALEHIRFARDSDLVLVAPATAQLLARAALGLADDLLTALLLARSGPVLAAPAMNDRMFAHPATRRNLRALAGRGWQLVGPDVGPLAEGDAAGPGRMSEPDTLFAHAVRALAGDTPWRGRHVLVTAGPTREPLDPVRVITNPSSGRMGFALAQAAWRRGAEVTLIAGPTSLEPPIGPEVMRVVTTAELQRAVARRLGRADVLLMAAAPADFRPHQRARAKLRRGGKPELSVKLEPTPDVLTATRPRRRRGAITVGFALEFGRGLASARAKLADKALDFIVLNDAREPGAGFEVGTNKVTILGKKGLRRALSLMPKHDVAEAILDTVESVL